MVNDLDGLRDPVTLQFKRGAGGSATGTVQVVAWQPMRSAGLLDNMPGADASDVPLWARLINPRDMPATIHPGDLAIMDLNGLQGAAVLQPYLDPRTGTLRDLFGQRILLAWRARGV